MLDFYRVVRGRSLSSIGIGTYLGPMDQATDDSYRDAVLASLRAGVTVIDTSLNYRNQRSERAIARALAQWTGPRESYMVCTKAGYLVPGAVPDGLDPASVVQGMHCLAPGFLDDQLARSLDNLGLDVIDVFYLHNPETQFGLVEDHEFYARMAAAFEFCERAVAAGRIREYGVATWDAFRRGPASVSLRRLHAVAGPAFRWIQLPVNLAMAEALIRPVEDQRSVLEVAAELGITAIASASLLQTRLLARLPDALERTLGGRTAAQRAIQFTRSVPGVTVALVGMSRPEHVAENLELAGIPPVDGAVIRGLFRQ